MSPVRLHRPPLGRRDQGLSERVREHAGRKKFGEALLQADTCLLIFLVTPACHPGSAVSCESKPKL